MRAVGGVFDNVITFKAFSPLGEASVFVTEIREYFFPYHQFEIRSVRIKSSRSDHNGNISGQELPPDFPQQLTLSDVCFPLLFHVCVCAHSTGSLYLDM